MMLLTLAPVAYDADRGTLEVTTRAQVSVRFSGGDLAATVARKERLASRHYDAFLGRATVNLNLGLESANWAYPDNAPVEFLIITPPQFVAALEPFVEWKTSCGYHVSVRHHRRGRHHDHSHQELHHRPLQRRDAAGLHPDDRRLAVPLVTYARRRRDRWHDLPYVQMDGDSTRT